jgi:branched-chain amino acid transport system substrate-binding protein
MLRFLCVLAALALLAGAPASTRAAAAPFAIDAIVSLTGSGAFLGSEQAAAIRLVEAAVNAHGGIDHRPIAFTIVDDQSSPQVAVQVFNAALAHHPQVVIGSSLVASCSAIAPLLHDGPVVYCFSAGMRPPPGSYMFAYGSSTADLMRVMVHYFRTRGWRRIGAVFPTDASGQDGEHALDLALARPENAGLTLVAHERFNTADVSVNAQLTRLRAANPQAIVAWGTGASLGTVLRGANDIGLDVPFAASAANLNYNVMKQFAAFLPHDLLMVTVPGVAPDAVGPGPLRGAALAYYDAIKATGTQPDANMITAYDPSLIVVDALRRLGLQASAANIRAYLDSLHGWYGAAGQYDFRDGSQRGLSASTMIVVRFDTAKQAFVPVSGIGAAPLPRR